MKDLTPAASDAAMPAISRQIWDAKYRFKEADGTPIDMTPLDSRKRVAASLAGAEADPAAHIEAFETALESGFLPAGRILAGAGTERNVTLFNCFVMGTIPDSMEGIFESLKEAALTMQQGGGIGYDFSPIRPKSSRVKGVGSDASGPLTFMDVWDMMCNTIMSAGSRRGAMMATMICTHPDILDFVEVKRDAARLRKFNLSVLVSDALMEAVRADAEWPLVHAEPPATGEMEMTEDGLYIHSRIMARDLWDRIMQSTYDFAEPGVIFIDRINKRNNLSYCETIAATNPCGEQPLPPYGACLLGSINLARLITDPFSDRARIRDEDLGELVATAVRMMDNVIDVSRFPLEAQRKEAQDKRRIGLGVTGLADALAMMGIVYGSDAGVAKTEDLMRRIAHAAYRASVQLATEKGAFPLFDAEKFLQSPTVQDLDADLQEEIRTHGIRNGLLTSIAPTGTISLYDGNVSSGVEPVFSHAYTRKVLQKDGSQTEEEVVDYAVQLYRDMFGADAELPDHFVTAMTLKPEDHVRMQAAAQKWVDSSISKTVNCPEGISFEEFKSVYDLAYASGCKGCTTYRPNEITGSILTDSNAAKEKAAERGAAETSISEPMPRDEELDGSTYKIKWPGAAHAYYVTINDVTAGGVRRPFEIFVNTQNTHDADMMDGLTRMISAVFRRGGDVSFVAEELSQIVNPQGGTWAKGKYVPSLVAMIGQKLFQHMRKIGYLPEEEGAVAKAPDAPEAVSEVTAPRGQRCASCGTDGVVEQGGCRVCRDCGASSCS